MYVCSLYFLGDPSVVNLSEGAGWLVRSLKNDFETQYSVLLGRLNDHAQHPSVEERMRELYIYGRYLARDGDPHGFPLVRGIYLSSRQRCTNAVGKFEGIGSFSVSPKNISQRSQVCLLGLWRFRRNQVRGLEALNRDTLGVICQKLLETSSSPVSWGVQLPAKLNLQTESEAGSEGEERSQDASQ